MDSCRHRPHGSSQVRPLAPAPLTACDVRTARLALHDPIATGLNLLCLLVLGLAVSLPARAAPKVQTFHIEAGHATLTLNEFSRQSTLQLLFDYNIVRGRRTRAISGEYEAPAALRQMLADTGLVFERAKRWP